jgi:adenosylmethionine-8-amino-7-oxononanoate aminotransferase
MSITSSRNEEILRPFMRRGQLRALTATATISGPRAGQASTLRRAIEQEILAQGPDTVAAVIGEPVSVSNSNHVPSPRYWQRVREICDTHGVLLVMDEVINGFGRTGTMFTTEQFGVVPDLMTMAKGLSSGYAPIAAVAVGRALFDEFKKQDVALAHLLTFGGQAVSCAAALKTSEILSARNCRSAAPSTANTFSVCSMSCVRIPPWGMSAGSG